MMLKHLLTLAIVLSLIVVGLGAYTRLTDAGLGCPDWPGCYGYTHLPGDALARQKAQAQYPNQPIEATKAWTEMIHRYAASLLGLLVLVSTCLSWRIRQARALSLGLCGWIIFQALLGMWTVTWRLLPLVVIMHLLSGAILLLALVIFRFQKIQRVLPPLPRPLGSLMIAAGGIIFIQMALGGWVSANYAGIACIGFPTCNGQWWPVTYDSFQHALQTFTHTIGVNYQGGISAHETRVTIQMSHRFFAIIVVLYVGGVMAYLYGQVKHQLWRNMAIGVGLLLWIQVGLGVVNVIYFLPLSVAVLHNLVAVCLFSMVGMMGYAARSKY